MIIRFGLALAVGLAGSTAASAQERSVLDRVGRALVREAVRPAIQPPRLALACGIAGQGIAGGANGIIGEKGSGDAGIIGEKRPAGDEGIIGEKRPAGEDGIIGEKRPAGQYGGAPMVLANRWNANDYTTFRHVIEGPPGKVNLSLKACTDASGGETVAVYLMDRNGARKTGWRMFVIATRKGNARSGSLTLPMPARGQTLSKLPIMVVVENASGRPHVGEYQLTVTR